MTSGAGDRLVRAFFRKFVALDAASTRETMSYQVLARKWRPSTFADTVGQSHVRQALTNALESGRLHHAYLFAGTRGVGKTTLARIFAKALNCESGVTGEPCGECGACHEIDEGRFVDLIEVDAASRTRVDDTRELLDNVQYAPARGRFKVYLIDEVHMLSAHSFNALLKTLEEPPDHVKFLLATTDPQKLPVTVLSRCLQFNLTRLSPRLIADRMAEILQAEDIKHDTSALDLLSRSAAGSMRDGLSLLDQAIAFGAGSVHEADTRRILGTVDRNEISELLHALADGDGQQLMGVIARADEQAPDYRRLLDELAGVLQKVAVEQVIGDSGSEDELVVALASLIDPEDVQLYYQIALNGKRDLPMAPDERVGFEMTLLRMLAFRPAGNAVTQVPPATAKSASQTAAPAKVPAASAKKKSTKPKPVSGLSAANSIPEQPDWFRLIPELDITGVERMLAGNCAWERTEGQSIFLTLDERFAAQFTDARRELIEGALTRHFATPVSLKIEIGRGSETPTQRLVRQKEQSVSDAQLAIQEDPNVKVMQQLFGAAIDQDTVVPIEAGAATASSDQQE